MTKEWKRPDKKPPARLFVGLLKKPDAAPILVCTSDPNDGSKLRLLDSMTPEKEQELLESMAHALVPPVIHSDFRFFLQNGGEFLSDKYQLLSGSQLAAFYRALGDFREAMVP